jgi:hypothetical protein
MAEKAKKNNSEDGELGWPFGMKNYLLFGLALVVIAIGYITLGYGSITLSPILLVVGYCVLIPISLIIKDKKVGSDSNGATE